MKPWTMWFARLGIAGACVMAVGCGEAVPDASSDGQAATDAAPPPDGGGAVPPPATPLTQRQQPRVAGGPGARKGEEAPADETAAPTSDAEKAPAATPSRR